MYIIYIYIYIYIYWGDEKERGRGTFAGHGPDDGHGARVRRGDVVMHKPGHSLPYKKAPDGVMGVI